MKLLIRSFLKKNIAFLSFSVILQTIANICTIIIPLSYQYLIDKIILKNSFDKLPYYVVGILVVFIVYMITDIFSNKVFIKYTIEFKKILEKSVMATLLKSEDKAMKKATKGEVITRLAQDIDTVINFWAEYFIALLMGVAEYLIVIIVIFRIHFALGLISLVATPLFYLLSKKMGKNIGEASIKLRNSSEKFIEQIDECLDSRETVKIYNCFNYEYNRYVNTLKTYLGNTKWLMNITLLSKKFIGGLSILFPLIILLSGSFLISLEQITLGSLISVLSSLNYILAPSAMLSNSLIAYKQVKVSYNRLLPFFEREKNMNEETETIKEPLPSFDKCTEVPVFSVNKLYFQYEDYEVLKNISFQINQKDFISIVGDNGTGKTTLIRILSGLLEPTQGEIFINGLLLNKDTVNKVREDISIVMQKEFLFQDTIENNILLQKTDSLNEIAKKVIDSKLLCLDVGKNGSKLSGGEIQKVAIARALQKNSNIFMIDEGSTNFDKRSRETLYEILQALKGKKTIMVIDHYLSYISLSDKVLYFQDKEHIFLDTHESLYNNNSHYRDFYSSMEAI
ncbi:ABC transporter ATP-binding protein [Ruminiclostridium herbifermentans]|uniref:ABC transporter ATP-binding protein n=1 Tax=Ruminiclostridium herbifermentans TaxID=2488810 RepID=A0A4U7JGK1_9FIRM|nr:ABC transporter ATP-binding protein [Ruminiclostridium herbifermentans]QNU67039.1 ABC transporter ATP-binding protein [Ruminiclostridium herbifermentans]